MTPTIPQQPGTCPGCAALQQQVEDLAEHLAALDRGLIETATTVGRALERAADIEGGIADIYRHLPRPPQPEPSEHERKLLRAADLGMEVLPGGAA